VHPLSLIFSVAEVIECPITLAPEASIGDAIHAIDQAQVDHALVGFDGQCVGLVTLRELVQAIATANELSLAVATIMTQPVITLDESALEGLEGVFAIAAHFKQQQVCLLPVERCGQCIGVVTAQTLLKAIAPTLLHLRSVETVMTPVVCAAPDSTILDLAQLMMAKPVSEVAIATSDPATAQRTLLGQISAGDIVRCQAQGLNLAQTSAESVMSAPRSVQPQDTLWMAYQQMQQSSSVMVTDIAGCPIGNLTPTCLLKMLDPIELFQTTASLQQALTTQTEVALQMQTQFQTSEAKLNAILSNAIAAVSQFRVFSQQNWECEDCSPGCEKIFGYSSAELTADQTLWVSRILPKDWETVVLPVFDDIVAERTVTIEFRFRHKNGSLRWASSTLIPQWNAALNAGLVTCVTTDITDRKRGEAESLQAEDAFWQSEERFSSLVHNILGVVYRCLDDSDWTMLFINDFIEELSGYPASDFINGTRSWNSVIYPDDRLYVEQMTHEAIAMRQPFIMEYRVLHRDGGFRWVFDKGQGMFDPAGNLLYIDGAFFDISEIKQLQAERQQTQAALQLQLRRDQVIATITQRVRQSLDLNEVLTTAVSEVRQFLQVDRVLIYRFNPDWSGDVVVESVSSPDLSILQTTIADQCFENGWHHFYQHGRISAIAAIADSHLDPCYVELMNRLQVQANLVVPLLQGDLLWGLLIAHHCQDTRHWETWEVDLLQQLSIQLAIAIQQSELYHQVHQLNASLEQQVAARTAELQQALDYAEALKRITDKVRDGLDETQILQTAVKELTQVLDGCRSDTCLYHFEQGVLTISNGYSDEILIPNNTSVQLEEFSDILPQLLAGQYLQFCEIARRPYAPSWRPTAIIACPIADDQTVLGNLWLFREPEQTFSQSEIELAQQVANQCAIAIRQSRLYQAAQAQVTELERLNHLKDDFLSTVSHELRTPMSSIKMATEMLDILMQRTHVFDQNQQILKYFQILQNECHREITLIDNLLDLSRLEAGTEPLMLLTVDLNNWILDVTQPFVDRSQNQQQHLRFDLTADLPPCTTDLAYLEGILRELLDNACKYTPSGETIVVSTNLLPSKAGQRSDRIESLQIIAAHAMPASVFQVSVSNSGVEISDQEYNRVFDKFYRIPNNDPWKHGGTGLGLALVKRRVEQLKGTITVKSEAGWTTFTVSLPPAVQRTIAFSSLGAPVVYS
jgi:PAS domain S-box-containing protein